MGSALSLSGPLGGWHSPTIRRNFTAKHLDVAGCAKLLLKREGKSRKHVIRGVGTFESLLPFFFFGANHPEHT